MDALLIQKLANLKTSLEQVKKIYQNPEQPAFQQIPTQIPTFTTVQPFQPTPQVFLSSPTCPPPTFSEHTKKSSHKEKHIHKHKHIHNPSSSSDPLATALLYNAISRPTHVSVSSFASPQPQQYQPQNKDKSKSKSDSMSTSGAVLAAGSFMTLSAASTYIVAKDEYVIYCLSNVHQCITELMMMDLTSITDQTLRNEIIMLNQMYISWYDKFSPRTKGTLIGKTGILGSGFAGIACACLAGGPVAWAGVTLGATASSCYVFWKWLTDDKQIEQGDFNTMLNKVDTILLNLKGTSSMDQVPPASAPPIILTTSEPSAPSIYPNLDSSFTYQYR